jgi:hypothetical protein
MEQESVTFRATIVEPSLIDSKIGEPPMLPPPPSPLEPIFEEKPFVPMPVKEKPAVPMTKASCCLPEPEHPFERLERQSELAEALPTIFIGFGVAYAIGILTGFVIFSPPSYELIPP